MIDPSRAPDVRDLSLPSPLFFSWKNLFSCCFLRLLFFSPVCIFKPFACARFQTEKISLSCEERLLRCQIIWPFLKWFYRFYTFSLVSVNCVTVRRCWVELYGRKGTIEAIQKKIHCTTSWIEPCLVFTLSWKNRSLGRHRCWSRIYPSHSASRFSLCGCIKESDTTLRHLLSCVTHKKNPWALILYIFCRVSIQLGLSLSLSLLFIKVSGHLSLLYRKVDVLYIAAYS